MFEIKQHFIVLLNFTNTKIENYIEVSNNYKRAQCPPILKISSKAFGAGRKMPF